MSTDEALAVDVEAARSSRSRRSSNNQIDTERVEKVLEIDCAEAAQMPVSSTAEESESVNEVHT